MDKGLIQALSNKVRVFFLRRAIRRVEQAGLAVVQIKRTPGAIYIIGSNGTYVRYDKEKKA